VFYDKENTILENINTHVGVQDKEKKSMRAAAPFFLKIIFDTFFPLNEG